MSITTDFWSDRNNRCYIVITGHYYESDFQLKSKVLMFSTFDERHTAAQISRKVTCRLRQLKVLHKIDRVVSDGASNIVNTIDHLNFGGQRIWCIAHRLHLVLTNSFALWLKKSNNNNNMSDSGRKNCYLNVCGIKL